MDLASYLKKESIPPGSRLSRFEWDGAHAEATIKLSLPPGSNGNAKWSLTFVLSEVLECSFHKPKTPPAGEEAVTITQEDPFLWDYGPWTALFANTPLPDPRDFLFEYLKLCAALRIAQPLRYLNHGEDLKAWESIVFSTAYLLLEAPSPLAAKVEELLTERKVFYTSLPVSTTDPTPPLVVVRLNECSVVCRKATVRT